jgi:hypothetical protein
MDFHYETIPLVDNNNEPFNLNELMRFNREDYNHNTQNKVQNDEKEDEIIDDEIIDDSLLNNLLKPIVFNQLYDKIKRHFVFPSSNRNIDITLQMQKLKKLVDFEKKYSSRLSLITKEELSYFVFSGYITIIKPILLTTVRNMNVQDFQHFQSISIFLLKNKLFRTEDENTVLNQILNVCTDALNDTQLSEERRFSIVDIFLHSCQDDFQRRELENELEEYRNRGRNEDIKNIKKNKYEISTDNQNVHDIILNTLYRRKCILIEKDNIPSESINTTISKYYKLRDKYCNTKTKLINKIKSIFGIDNKKDKKNNFAFNRIKTDLTVFSPTTLTLSDIFQRVFYRVLRLEQKDYFGDILERIEEECIEMQETCATGHMTRLLNILSGYPEVDIEVVAFYVDEMEQTIRKMFESEYSETELEDSYISFGEERKSFEEYVQKDITIGKYHSALKRVYVYQNNTHNEFLFNEDFAEAYSKFGNFTLNSSYLCKF